MKFVTALLQDTDYLSILTSLEELERTRVFCCHGLEHLLDVARIAYILSLEKNLPLKKETIYLTALLHDIGRYDVYTNTSGDHAESSMKRAKEWLHIIHYPQQEIEYILDAIQGHRHHTKLSPQHGNHLLSVIKEADHLSRLCFRCSAESECYWSSDRKNQSIIY